MKAEGHNAFVHLPAFNSDKPFSFGYVHYRLAFDHAAGRAMDPVGKRYENKGINDHANDNNDTPWFGLCQCSLFEGTVTHKGARRAN